MTRTVLAVDRAACRACQGRGRVRGTHTAAANGRGAELSSTSAMTEGPGPGHSGVVTGTGPPLSCNCQPLCPSSGGEELRVKERPLWARHSAQHRTCHVPGAFCFPVYRRGNRGSGRQSRSRRQPCVNCSHEDILCERKALELKAHRHMVFKGQSLFGDDHSVQVLSHHWADPFDFSKPETEVRAGEQPRSHSKSGKLSRDPRLTKNSPGKEEAFIGRL
ncbi:uncharacterized protein LOC104848275 [Fukomys damarensis]|uniref:uncharacterized protein LOC104848275 n=1 Tax=Fukomys damarensis TaxID=885580 RepID=UPI000540281B|nr:uncharacterized protein LOC104848275 [Fukomys damarensis]